MRYQDMAALWADHPRFDENTRAEVRALFGDSDELLSRFGRELAFGTGGMRGLRGTGTNRMNRYTVARVSQGLAAYLLERGGQSVAIAYDSRIGSREFALVTAGVLAHNGIRAWCFDRLMPTPVLSFAVREMGCDAGVMITASHNPAQYNGYKVYGPDGCQVTDDAAKAITFHIERVDYAQLAWMSEDEARTAGLLNAMPESVYRRYIELTLSCRLESGDGPWDLRFVYTPLHGTGLEPVCDVFSRMGALASCTIVPEQREPDGNFPTCPRPNPELPEALALALRTAEGEDAALVLATDPDSDRVGVAVREEGGGYRLLTGNEVGLLLLMYILSVRRQMGTLPGAPVVIKTIVTSDLTFAIARDFGTEVVEVLTGFKYIGEAIGCLEKEGQADRFILGFEESCGYLAGSHVRDKDGVMTAMLVADMVRHYARRGQSVSEVLGQIYETYGYMENRLLNFDIVSALPMQTMDEIMATLRENPPAALGGIPIRTRRDYLQGLSGLPPADVLSFENERGDKAIIRPSGTEPKMKIYLCACGKNPDEAKEKLTSMAAEASDWVG